MALNFYMILAFYITVTISRTYREPTRGQMFQYNPVVCTRTLASRCSPFIDEETRIWEVNCLANN